VTGKTRGLILDLSLEFLMGRTLDNAMLNIGMKDIAARMVLFTFRLIW
jgi:hypothetical protein